MGVCVHLRHESDAIIFKWYQRWALRHDGGALNYISTTTTTLLPPLLSDVMLCDSMYKLRRHVKFTSDWESRIQNVGGIAGESSQWCKILQCIFYFSFAELNSNWNHSLLCAIPLKSDFTLLIQQFCWERGTCFHTFRTIIQSWVIKFHA